MILKNIFNEQRITAADKIKIMNFIKSEEGKEFYKNYKDLNACIFNKELLKHGLKEKKTFMLKVFKSIYKIESFKNYLDDSSNLHKKICYDKFSNFDNLTEGLISHDTLLKYFYKIVKISDLLKQILIDRFPVFLVDEYQDTSQNVIEILSILDEYAINNNRRFVVGYFGDEMQNIYNNGIGKNINKFHKNLKLIEKKYNRRSFIEIINIANKIRNDSLVQESIYENANGAIIKCYKGNKSDFHDLIEVMKDNLNDKNEKFVCFVAVNKDVAYYNGFFNLYSFFYKCKFYKKHFDLLNSELIVKDISKLGSLQLLLFKIIDLFIKFNESKTLISDLGFADNISIDKIKKNIRKFDLSRIETLNDMFKVIFNDYYMNDDFNLNEKKSLFNGKTLNSIDDLYKYLNEFLFSSSEEQDDSSIENNLKELLNIKIDELKNWYYYVLDDKNQSISYRTLHSTKGLEFDNVLIVLENKFGKNKNYFKSLFENIKDKSSNQEARNLLYVAITRAKKSITVYYMEPSLETEKGLEYLFGEVKTYSKTVVKK